MMKLRILLASAFGLAAACSSSGNPSPSPAPEREAVPLPSAEEVAARELTADDQVRQAIDRLTFGARNGDYDSVRAIGVDRWIARQLDPASIRDREADSWVERFPTLGESAEQLLSGYPPPGVEKRKQGKPMTAADSIALKKEAERSRRLLGELQTAKVGRALLSERQLNEVMVDFWLDHFSVYAAKGPVRYYLPEYERTVIRPYALGKFRTLLGAVAHSPAMLYYLDNWESRANADEPTLASQRRQGGGRSGGYGRGGFGRPPSPPPQNARRQQQGLNENYARELMELHTLGVDGGYTQEDVIAVARAFTGWSIEKPQQQGTFVFHPEWHDAGPKTVLSHDLPSGEGMEDGERVLDILAYEPHTAAHIATRLVQRFVSDTAPPELVERAANEFLRTGGDIRETVRVIVTSPEFFSQAAYRSKVKSPFRLVVSALRAVDASADTSTRTAQIVARLGEPLYLHQAPNGYPLTGESWINTGSILNRINFGLAVAGGRVPGVDLAVWPAGAALADAPRDEQVNGAIALLLGGEVSPDTRRVLQSGFNPLLAAAPASDSARTALADSLEALDQVDASMASTGLPAPDDARAGRGGGTSRPARGGGGGARKTGVNPRYDPLAKSSDLEGFAQIVGLALGAPEFQRH